MVKEEGSKGGTLHLNDDNISTMLMNLTVAGHTTISSLMSSLLNILVHYPEVKHSWMTIFRYLVNVKANCSIRRKSCHTVVLLLSRGCHSLITCNWITMSKRVREGGCVGGGGPLTWYNNKYAAQKLQIWGQRELQILIKRGVYMNAYVYIISKFQLYNLKVPITHLKTYGDRSFAHAAACRIECLTSWNQVCIILTCVQVQVKDLPLAEAMTLVLMWLGCY